MLLHVAFLILALGTMGGGSLKGAAAQNGEESVIELSIAGRAGGARPAEGNPEEATIADLLTKVQTARSVLQTEQQTPHVKGDLSEILEVSEKASAPPKPETGSGGRSSLDLGGKGADTTGPKAATAKTLRSDVGGSVGPGAGVGSLWGQIKPCWDHLPQSAAVPVTLAITLDTAGRIAKPPRIVRPSGAAPDEKRLLSEARAIAAVTGCVPYNLSGGLLSAHEYTLHFGAGS